MKKLLFMAFAVLCMNAMPAMAQQGKPNPKQAAAKLSESLHMTPAQKGEIEKLNEKYSGDDYDKRAYMREFRGILTEEQKQQMQKMREARQNERSRISR